MCRRERTGEERQARRAAGKYWQCSLAAVRALPRDVTSSTSARRPPSPGTEKQTRTLPPRHVRRSIATSLRNLYSPYSAMAKAIRHEFCPFYIEELVGPTRARYESKVKICDGVDTYVHVIASARTPHVDVQPVITHVGVINCLVSSTNYVSRQQMKAFKALIAHNYFTTKWVKSLTAMRLPSKRIVVLSEAS
ncbi:hypothetical protein ISCGN_010288 [Ixodes scapularis]